MTLVKLNTLLMPERIERIKRRECLKWHPVLMDKANQYLKAEMEIKDKKLVKELYLSYDNQWRQFTRRWNVTGNRQNFLRETEFEDLINWKHGKNKNWLQRLGGIILRSIIDGFRVRGNKRG